MCFQYEKENAGVLGLCIVAMMLSVALALPATSLQEEPSSDLPVAEIQVTARKYKFTPNVITVKKGQLVRLNITAEDRDHGIRLKDFDLNQRLVKGVPTTVEFTPTEAGTFVFRYSVRCGWRHGKMKGELVVEEDLP